MLERSLVIAIALVVSSFTTARAFDDTLYPNLKGQWTRFVVRGLSGQPSLRFAALGAFPFGVRCRSQPSR